MKTKANRKEIMKSTDNPIDQAFKVSSDNLQVSISSDLWERFEKHNSKKRSSSLINMSMRIAASVALVLTTSFLVITGLSKDVVVVDLAANTSSEKYNAYKDYLKSDQYAQLKTSYEVIK